MYILKNNKKQSKNNKINHGPPKTEITVIFISIVLFYRRGAYDKFPDFFRVGV